MFLHMWMQGGVHTGTGGGDGVCMCPCVEGVCIHRYRKRRRLCLCVSIHGCGDVHRYRRRRGFVRGRGLEAGVGGWVCVSPCVDGGVYTQVQEEEAVCVHVWMGGIYTGTGEEKGMCVSMSG